MCKKSIKWVMNMPLSQITAYNVGHGDCLLLKFFDGDKESFLLLDCGSTRPQDDKLKEKWEEKWKDIANDIAGQLRDCKCDEISFMLTHFHKDHYNGFYEVYNCLEEHRITLNTFYSTAFVSIEKNGDPDQDTFVDFLSLIRYRPIVTISSNQSANLIDKAMKILWPPVPYSLSNLVEYFIKYVPEIKNFLTIYMEQHGINDISLFATNEDENSKSLVFEVDGVNNQKYLFAGDLSNQLILSYYLSQQNSPGYFSQYINEFNIIDYSTSSISGKYKMVKMPHHGKEKWPIEKQLLIENGYTLVSMGEYSLLEGQKLVFSQFPNVIATNYTENYTNPPWTNVFKIQIDISSQGDTVSFSEETNKSKLKYYKTF